VLAKPGMFFAMSPVQEIMNGLPRAALPSEFNLLPILIYFLNDTFIAFAASQFVIHFAAFFGMLLLLKNHYIKEDDSIAYGVALCFSLIPFWPTGGLSVAGVPLILNSLFNISANRSSIFDWLAIAVVPFFSFLVVSYIFFIPVFGVYWIIQSIRTKKPELKVLAALALFASIFIFVDFRLFQQFLSAQEFIPHRAEFNRVLLHKDSGLLSLIDKFFTNLFKNYDDAQTFPVYQKFLITPAIILAFILCSVKKYRADLGRLGKTLSLIIIITLWYSLYYWAPFIAFTSKLSFLKIFNFSRFSFIQPFLWYLAFAFALSSIVKIKYGRQIAAAFIALQVLFLFSNNPEITERMKKNPSYQEFYSQKLFETIAAEIREERKDYRVVSVGMHPSIALYNGFYTLDLYNTIYRLDYKHAFRRIIEKELAKNEAIRDYFDLWGNRCYVFTSELPFLYWDIAQYKEYRYENLELNTEALKSLGGKYILSAVNIVNFKNNGLDLIGSFEDSSSPYRIRVYKIL